MESQIVQVGSFDLVPAGADKHTRYRLRKFQAWMSGQGRPGVPPE